MVYLKAVGLIILVFLIVTISFIFYLTYQESPNRYFKQHKEALYLNMWVPKIFPTDIVDVYEQHNLDSNEVWLRFRPGLEEFQPTEFGFKELSFQELEGLRTSEPFMVGWWFERQELRPSYKMYKGSCDGRGDVKNMVALVLVTQEYTYWWCQYP